MKQVLLKAGYTLRVTSWENNGNNYATKEYNCGMDKELVKGILVLLEMCRSGDRNKYCVGDGWWASTRTHLIEAFAKQYPNIISVENYMNSFYDLTHKLLGYTEAFDCRVFESCEILYTEQDITVKILSKYELNNGI